MNMKFNNIISIVSNSKKTTTSTITIFKRTTLEFTWMESSQLVISQDSNILPINTHRFKQIILIIFNNNKIRTYIVNKMKNKNINQTLIEKTDLQAATKSRRTKISIRKMRKNHLEFHQLHQKENKLKVLAIKEISKVIVKLI